MTKPSFEDIALSTQFQAALHGFSIFVQRLDHRAQIMPSVDGDTVRFDVTHVLTQERMHKLFDDVSQALDGAALHTRGTKYRIEAPIRNFLADFTPAACR